MNIKMDAMAKQKVTADGSKRQLHGTPYEGWVCSVEGNRTVKNLTTVLHTYLNGGPIIHHWEVKQRFHNGIKDIDWDMTASAMKALPRAQQQWVSKMATKFLPCGTNMKRWGLRTQAKCPRCSCLTEDKEHVLRCPAEEAKAKWNQAIEELDNWMRATKTHPQLCQDIIMGLQHWHDDQPISRMPTKGSLARESQDNIGWGVALEGCVSLQWREEQDRFWKAFKSRKSSKRWTTKLIKHLILTAWDMWQHRNKALHESKQNKQEIVEDNINQQIQQVYAQDTSQFPQAARLLMKRPLQCLLRLPASYKHQWMATLVAVRNQVQYLTESHNRLVNPL